MTSGTVLHNARVDREVRAKCLVTLLGDVLCRFAEVVVTTKSGRRALIQSRI